MPKPYSVVSPRTRCGQKELHYTRLTGLVSAREVAELNAFLSSEESSGVDGEAITFALGGM